MRDPNRIDPTMEQLAYVWKKCFPDWRFMQFIVNFQSWLGSDGFYIEDDKIVDKFCEFATTLHAPRVVNNTGVGPT